MRDFLPLVGSTPPGDDDGLDQLFAGFLACCEASWTTFPDVDGALVALAGTTLELAVLTNGSTQQQNAKLEAVALGGRVGRVFTAEELGVAKPDPSAYLSVCRSLGADPSGVLHVGDLYDLDVIAPRAAGLQAVHLDRFGTGPREEPARIASLDQLPALLGYE